MWQLSFSIKCTSEVISSFTVYSVQKRIAILPNFLRNATSTFFLKTKMRNTMTPWRQLNVSEMLHHNEFCLYNVATISKSHEIPMTQNNLMFIMNLKIEIEQKKREIAIRLVIFTVTTSACSGWILEELLVRKIKIFLQLIGFYGLMLSVLCSMISSGSNKFFSCLKNWIFIEQFLLFYFFVCVIAFFISFLYTYTARIYNLRH